MYTHYFQFGLVVNNFLKGIMSNQQEGDTMKTRERLMECKIKEGIKSDYALAKRLGINPARICDYMAGRRTPDAYTAIKMAEILKVHPLLLLAEFEAESEKDETKRTFWINFVQRIKAGTLGMLALICTAFWSPGPKAEGLILDTHNA